MLASRNCNGVLLETLQLLDAAGGEVQQGVEELPVERHPLGGRLDLDEARRPPVVTTLTSTSAPESSA